MMAEIPHSGVAGLGLNMALSTTQAANYLGMSVRQVARLCEEGKLKACKLGQVWSIDSVSVEYYENTPKDKGGRQRKGKRV